MIKVEITGENPLEVFAQTAVYGVKLLQISEVREASDLVLNMEKHWKATKEALQNCDIEKHYFVPCPHCGEMIEFKWASVFRRGG